MADKSSGRLVMASKCRFGSAKYQGSFAMFTDITARRAAEKELLLYKDQLEETVQQRTAELLVTRDAAEAANKAKSMFLANMSHEVARFSRPSGGVNGGQEARKFGGGA